MRKSKILMFKLCYPISNDISHENTIYNHIPIYILYKIELAFIELKNNINNSDWVIYPPLL